MSLSLVSATDTLQQDIHRLSVVDTSTHTSVHCVSVYTYTYIHIHTHQLESHKCTCVCQSTCLCTSHHTCDMSRIQTVFKMTLPLCPSPQQLWSGATCVLRAVFTWTSTLRPLHSLSVCLIRGLWNQHNTMHLLRNRHRPQNTSTSD